MSEKRTIAARNFRRGDRVGPYAIVSEVAVDEEHGTVVSFWGPLGPLGPRVDRDRSQVTVDYGGPRTSGR